MNSNLIYRDWNGNFAHRSHSWRDYVPGGEVETIAATIIGDYTPGFCSKGLTKAKVSRLFGGALSVRLDDEDCNVMYAVYEDGSERRVEAVYDINGYLVCNGLGIDHDATVNYARLVYTIFNGDIPADTSTNRWVIDHINSIHTDNRPENLRLLNHKVNYLRPYMEDESFFSKLFLETHSADELAQLRAILTKWKDNSTI